MKVREIMSSSIISCDVETTADRAAAIMKEKKIGAIVVTKSGEPVGIATGRDIAINVVAADKKASEVPMSEVMSRYLVTIEADAPVEEAARVLGGKNLRRILVTEKGKIIGIITARSLLTSEDKAAEAAVQKFAEAAIYARDWRGVTTDFGGM